MSFVHGRKTKHITVTFTIFYTVTVSKKNKNTINSINDFVHGRKTKYLNIL